MLKGTFKEGSHVMVSYKEGEQELIFVDISQSKLPEKIEPESIQEN